MENKNTRNAVIDRLLTEGSATEQIVEAVLKEFPTAPLAAVKRQIYSRRNSLKSRATA